MSERILKALMQLFAIVARVDIVSKNNAAFVTSIQARKVVEIFLRSELNESLVREYLELFDTYIQQFHSNLTKNNVELKHKRTSVNSVKVLRICSQINQELTQRQKIIVLLRILEFIHLNNELEQQELEFATTVSDSFNISNDTFEQLRKHISSNEELIDEELYLYISNENRSLARAKNLTLENLDGLIQMIQIRKTNILIFKYSGKDQLILNGQLIPADRCYLFHPGSSLRSTKTTSIYYSDVINLFQESNVKDKLFIDVKDITYHFNKSKIGLHPIRFSEESGKLVGIMGSSGSGKSTLLSVLNGTKKPTSGAIEINGVNLHAPKSNSKELIGFVSQDDLLIEELTVFENIYFSTKLCFGNWSDQSIKRKVVELLNMIGLQDVMHLRVGSPLDQKISGGQRKRLNIALELIREPRILFVDEPTSGLSSRDSENIMDLLKELASKGKIIFTVIHQPSSDIFKIFDRLLILDKGGYLIYDGNPIDSIVYFKTCIHHANAQETECESCGNVNSEQIFNIIEAKIVDEFGNNTNKRKIAPEEWYARFKTVQKESKIPVSQEIAFPENTKPSFFQQHLVYFRRDFLRKWSNKQYVLLNLLEAPVLALIMAFFLKNFETYNWIGGNYSFRDNENIPQFIFISVIVSLFLGLTVSAEEIIKDQKNLKRESFLQLSWNSYLSAKVALMFLISAIQSLSFVLVGNFTLEISGLELYYWLMLFTASCSANLVGLIISATFNSEKVIYLAIPILIIPQLLFSGVIIKFSKLHPSISNPIEVPFLGNMMISRWAHEGLVVVQSKENRFQKLVYPIEKLKSQNRWKRDYWVPGMEIRMQRVLNPKMDQETFATCNLILQNEIKKMEKQFANHTCIDCIDELKKMKSPGQNIKLQTNMGSFLSVLKTHFSDQVQRATTQLDSIALAVGLLEFKNLKTAYENENLSSIVRNSNRVKKIVEYDNQLFQVEDPIYLEPQRARFLDAHFYAPTKTLFGKEMSTFWTNLIVIWLVTAGSYLALYFNVFKRILVLFSRNSRE